MGIGRLVALVVIAAVVSIAAAEDRADDRCDSECRRTVRSILEYRTVLHAKCNRARHRRVAASPTVALGSAIECDEVALLPQLDDDVTVAARADILAGNESWGELRKHCEAWRGRRTTDAMPVYLLAALAARDGDRAAAVTLLSLAETMPLFAPHVRERFLAVKAAAEDDGMSANEASGEAMAYLAPVSSISVMFQACKDLLGAVPADASERCRRLGERLERHGLTVIETMFGTRIQQLALTCDGCSGRPELLVDVSRRRARQSAIYRKVSAIPEDENDASTRAYFAELLRNGEESAMIQRIVATRRR